MAALKKQTAAGFSLFLYNLAHLASEKKVRKKQWKELKSDEKQSRRNYKRIYENWNKYVSSYKENYINESSHAFFLTFAWNFRFGRKYQSDGKKIYNQDNDSGIMNAGK